VVDFDTLKGKPCRLILDVDDQGYNTVERILPAKVN
jgi:hypothetical protein